MLISSTSVLARVLETFVSYPSRPVTMPSGSAGQNETIGDNHTSGASGNPGDPRRAFVYLYCGDGNFHRFAYDKDSYIRHRVKFHSFSRDKAERSWEVESDLPGVGANRNPRAILMAP